MMPSSSITISEVNTNTSKNVAGSTIKSTRTFKPLSIIFWVASVACVSFLLHGFDFLSLRKVDSLALSSPQQSRPPPQPYSSATENIDGPVTADMLDHVHAQHFYGANSTSIARLDTGVLPPGMDDTRVTSLRAARGAVYNEANYAKKANYELIRRAAMRKHRTNSPIHQPKGCSYALPNAWLGEFRNVWVDGAGDIYIPLNTTSNTGNGVVDVVHYSWQGGCCAGDWRVAVGAKPLQVKRGCHEKLAFAVAQHHGSTFSHLMDEGFPRLFSFWRVVHGVLQRGGKIMVAEHPLFPSILQSYFGIPKEQILQVSYDEPCFFERVILPEAYQQGSYPMSCVKAATEDVLRSLFLESSAVPTILLIERATKRIPNKCYGRRCMRNFHQLRDAIINEFGARVRVETIGPSFKGGIRATAKMFNRATVVVGVHGAGFANLMYMRQWGTHIIHLGWDSMWHFYARKADAHGIQFVNVLSHGASQNGDNVQAEIPVILLEIRRALKKEGYKLNPPVWRIDGRRNEVVVMRLPKHLRTRT